MKYYILKLQISSDSGVGPYSETKYIANCIYKDGEWWCIGRNDVLITVSDCFHTSMIDYRCVVMEFTEQPAYFVYRDAPSPALINGDSYIFDLPISRRAMNIMGHKNRMYLREVVECTEEDMMKIRNCGKKVFDEITTFLAKHGLKLKESK